MVCLPVSMPVPSGVQRIISPLSVAAYTLASGPMVMLVKSKPAAVAPRSTLVKLNGAGPPQPPVVPVVKLLVKGMKAVAAEVLQTVGDA